MALPANGAAWPPHNVAHIHEDFAIWSAWYANDIAMLRTAYSANGTPGPAGVRRGLLNRVADWFWTPKGSDGEAGVTKLHVPLASDLCQVSADLLYSEPPTFTVEDSKGKNKAVQDRLDLITGAGFDQTLIASAEVAAALGGSYLRATWDDSLYKHVFLTKVDADGALPVFRYGRLVEVTFWRVVDVEGTVFTRHLEHHSLNSFGIGVIEQALYQGSATDIGTRIPLTESAATKHLATVVDANSVISTQTPGLAVEYVPNMTPTRKWRTDPHGAYLGRSDLDGIESFLDALDRVYSSLMRELELGKARLVVPSYMMNDLGPGKGAAFDNDRAIISEVLASPGAVADSKLAIEKVQFDIRVTEHLEMAAALLAVIIRTAGYSSQTFGEKDATGGDKTATEVTAKERRSYLTRDRKIRAATPALERILFKALAMDAALFSTNLVPAPVTVAFADAVQTPLEALAATVNLLKQAESASIETRLLILHPDWDETQISAEAAKIQQEKSVFPDPATFGTVVNDGATPAGTGGQPAGNDRGSNSGAGQ
ncbi:MULTISPECIES: phage portal protein [Paenarthrobacter]|uniref:Phage portal protein n=1 Tax=Paenarthrobacter ureafaciens TaxID=37931 RepID=A0AAX3EI87_PAEUR|nr:MULTISPECIES: phage portal protein [Paenarthrobacter]MDO5866029.1 phage portal protein [Paenarthrobacter sp. SD-2]MDO5877126.1 phage portal protein [Paenarthrobacter sp. SD-1]UYV92327.1 phage portal protein [Paenarthrobacter ureafaciens]UYV96862.1 phage portal protein [Paenarthrobacter ureafaciens]